MRMNLAGAGRRPMDRVDGRPVYALAVAEDVSDALKNELGEKTYASPALSDGEIFLRGDTHLCCVGGGS